MSNREKEDGYVIVEMTEDEIEDILDGDYVHKEITQAGGYAVGEEDEEFVFFKDKNIIRNRARSQDLGDIRLNADGESWMGLLGGVENEIRWFQAGIEVRRS
jgi:hypothetical protein